MTGPPLDPSLDFFGQPAGGNPSGLLPISGGQPAPAAPPASPQQPSFLQNIGTWFKHAAQHAGQNLVPQPSNDLYSPQDVSQARHQAFLNFAAGLAGSPAGRTAGLAGGVANGFQAAQAGGQNALQQILQQRMQGVQVGQYQRIMATRQQVQQQYASAPGDTTADTLGKSEAAASALGLAGDFEGSKNASDVAAAIAKAHGLTTIDAGPAIHVVDNATGQVVRTIPKGVAPGQFKVEPLQPGATGVVVNPQTGATVNKIGSGAQITPQEGITDTLSLAKQYQEDTKEYWDREPVYTQLKGAIAAGKDPKTIALLAARLQTPNRAPGPATVDELNQMGSFGDQLKNLISTKSTGKMTPEYKQMLQSSVDMQMLAFRNNTLAHRQDMVGLGTRLGLDPTAVDHALSAPKVHLPGDPIAETPPLRPAPGGGVTTRTAPLPASPGPAGAPAPPARPPVSAGRRAVSAADYAKLIARDPRAANHFVPAQ